MRRPVRVLLLVAAVGCGSCSHESKPTTKKPSGLTLVSVDLSDERVRAMSLDDLWQVGVLHLGWAEEAPRSATKTRVHQALLTAKYENAWDGAYLEGPTQRVER